MSPLSRSSHALVTGGGRGIGLAISAALSKAGATVTVPRRNRAALDEAVASGAAQFAAVADVADQASVKSAVAEAAARQPIDILVANAGAAESSPFGRSDAALFQRMMDVNFMGVVHATQAVLPGMIERRHGRIVAVASTAGLKGYAYVSAYSAAKHAVIGLVRSLALETAKSGVTVNAVCPGFTETDLLEGSIDNIIKKTGRSREQAIAELSKHNPQGRLVTPQEVADAVLWVCAEGARAVTGQAIGGAGGEVGGGNNNNASEGAPMSRPANPVTLPLADYSPKHFLLAVVGGVATVTLNRPERKNPLTFESYRELTDFFRACAMDDEVKTIVVSGAGGNFSSGGDVFEIIGPLVQMDTKGLTAFTRMTGDLVKAMRACPQPIIASVEGICAGAGAIIAMASDLRLAATGAKVAFLFNKVGLAGCDMGACAILPRIIGQSRASELLYTGRFMAAEEGERWGFFSRIVTPDAVLPQAQLMAKQISDGPTFANTMTKRMLAMEWAMSVEEAIEAEAVAQALCMTTEDFGRAFEAFSNKRTPVFEGN